MYEMEEASPGPAAPAQPVTRLARRDVPPAGATHPQKPPVSRLPLRPWVTSGAVPVSNGETISIASAEVTQGSTAINLKFSHHPHGIHRTLAVIRTARRLSTGLFTAPPQITEGDPGDTRSARRHLTGHLIGWRSFAN